MTTPLCVLIVEDSEDDARLLLRALRRGGYDVTHERVDTPATMRAALENREWDVITSDHSMPNFSAPAALKLAKELRPQLPFLIISNEIDLNLAVSLMRSGAQDYIPKGELARAVPAIERELREVEMHRERTRAKAQIQYQANLLENVSDAIIATDLQFNIVSWNKAAESVYGWTAAEVTGHPFREFIQNEYLADETNETSTRQLMEHGSWKGEVEHKRRDGARVFILASVTLIKNQQGQPVGVVAANRDITERKQAEAALRQESAFSHTVINQAAEGICACHATTEYPFVAFTIWNDRMTGITGYTLEEINRLGWYQTMYPDPEMREQAAARMARMRQGDDILAEEWVITRADGEKRAVLISTSLLATATGETHILALMQDITDRKRAEEARERLFNYSIDMLCIAGFDGYFKQLNPAWERTLGWTKAELLARPYLELVHPDDRDATLTAASSLAEGHEASTFENRYLCKDGSYKWVAWNSFPLVEEGLVFAVTRDITERKRAEAEIKHLAAFPQLNPNPVIEVNADGAIIFCNAAALAALPQPGAADARALLPADLAEILQTPGDSFYREVQLGERLFGEDIYLRPASHSAHIYARDITDRRRAEQLIQMQTELLQAQNEELIAQHEELQSQNEELCAQQEEVQHSTAALRESEEKYRTVADFTYDWEYWIGPEGNFIYVSPACERITGHRAEEFVDNPALLETIIHPDDRVGYRQHRELDDERSFVFRILSRAGATRWISHRCQEVRTADGRLLGRRGSNRDITIRKLAEAELQQRAAYLRSILDNFPYLVWLKDTAGRFQAVNRAFAQASNQASPDALPGKTDLDIWPRSLAEQYRADDQAVMDNRAQKSVEELIADQGVEKWFETFKSPIFDAQGQVIGTTGFSRDITERKQMELQLRQAYEQIQAQYDELEAQHEELTAVNAELMDVDNTLRQYARRLEFLRETEQAILAARLPETIAEAALKNIRSFLACDRASVVTFDHAAQIALILAVDVNGQTSLWQGQQMTFADFGIVPLLQTGQTDLVPDLATQTNLSPVRTQLLAAGMHSILNIPLLVEDKLIGALNLADARPDVFLPEHIEVVSEIALSLAIVIQQAQLREQIQRHAEKLETRVRERTSQLEAINQELDAFSHSVSHDLRAPLRRIDGYSTALLEDYADKLDTAGQNHLRRIRAGCQRMNELTEDLLELSRLTQHDLQHQPIDLSALAKTVAAELQQSQPERAVELVIAEGLTVNADARLLRIVLENLLGNAWKFTARQEQARIEFGVVADFGLPIPDDEKTLPIAENQKSKIANPKSTYFVRDNGAGFDMAHADRLFGAFQRLHTDQEFPGTGIGLATVRRIIHRHGGRVWAEGAVNAGATIYFTL